MSHPLVAEVREGLARLADPARAPQMQAYMKSEMPFRGVPAPGVKALCRDVVARHPLGSRDEWESCVRELFDGAGFREERYAALHLAGHRRHRDLQTVDALPLYEHVCVSGAWWDLVDDVSNRVGEVLLHDRDDATPVLHAWAVHDDLWVRRASIICQRKLRAETDTDLLATAIEANVDSREFFLRKGIGWALREHAKVDASWVRAFVAAHELSPLSRREALKHVGAV